MGVGFGVAVGKGVVVGLGVLVGAGVGVEDGIGVSVGVKVGVGTAVAVGVGVKVEVGIGGAVGRTESGLGGSVSVGGGEIGEGVMSAARDGLEISGESAGGSAGGLGDSCPQAMIAKNRDRDKTATSSRIRSADTEKAPCGRSGCVFVPPNAHQDTVQSPRGAVRTDDPAPVRFRQTGSFCTTTYCVRAESSI